MIESTLNSTENSFGKKSISLLTVLFALCSILYELLLAQSLSSIMGNTILRYNMTIGLYVAAMGFGAIVYSKINTSETSNMFLWVELSLALTGFMAPFLVLVFDGVMFDFSKKIEISYYSNELQVLIFIFNHLLIVAIGFLSGFELPLLMGIFKKYSNESSLRILGLDYIGTLLGAISFPLFILPYLSIFQIGATVAIANLLGALFYGVALTDKKEIPVLSLIVVLLCFVVLTVFRFWDLESLVLRNFYYR